MHTSCNESTFENESMFTVEKDEVKTFRSNFEIFVSKLRAIFPD
jgi:hypothetical protein